MATVPVCLDVPAPADLASCVELVLVPYAEPFVLNEAVLAQCGEAFAAGLVLVVMFWGLGYGAGLIMKAIKS